MTDKTDKTDKALVALFFLALAVYFGADVCLILLKYGVI